MLIARAPVRISFAGGGTDLPAYYERYGGMVISATLNRYAYAIVEPTEEPHVHVSSADYGTFFTTREGAGTDMPNLLALPRAALEHAGVERGIDLFVATQVPPGTGLGSSSAVTAALVRVLAAAQGIELPPVAVAEAACEIEIGRLGMPIGKQDQYAAAFGGINAITFDARGVTVEPLHLTPMVMQRLEACLMLFFTGTARRSADILADQAHAIEHKAAPVLTSLDRIKALAREARQILEGNSPDALGELLHENWLYKRTLTSGIATSRIDEVYTDARSAGAIGGKITGAGGGGFLLLYCTPEHQDAVRAVLGAQGLRHMDVRFSPRGAHLLSAKEEALVVHGSR